MKRVFRLFLGLPPAYPHHSSSLCAKRMGMGTRRSLVEGLCGARIRPTIPLLTATALLAGCAHYTAAPLPPASVSLAPPDLAALSVDAQKIDRPWLKPQPIDLAAPLSPNALAVIAVLENPELKAQRARLGVTDAQAFAARLLPDPTFQANYDKLISGPDPFDAFGAQLGFDLNQLRTARVSREGGEASKRQVRLDLAWAEWQIGGQARLQGVRVLALEAQLRVAETSAASARDLFAAVQRAAGRGDVAATDLDARRQGLLDAEARLRTAEADLAAARADLDKLLGLPPETRLRLAPPAASPVPPATSILVAQAIDRRLDLAALRAGYVASEAELHKAVIEQFPNLSLTLAGARDTSNNKTIGPAIGFSLPLWNRNRGTIAIAAATREQLKAEYQARLFQTRAEIDAAVNGLVALRGQRGELAAQMPALERYAQATQRAARRGDLAAATADTAGQAVRDRRLTLLQLDQQIAEQTIALELLSGGPSEGWTQ
jgi:outer membrane protein TolC